MKVLNEINETSMKNDDFEQQFSRDRFNFHNNLQMQENDNYFSKQREKTLSYIYKNKFNKSLNWDNLKTFNEKMQWCKLYDLFDLKSKLTDKLEVRQWVLEKLGNENYLIPVIKIYEDPREISLDELPEKFVLKANHGCKMNMIIDKNMANINEIRKSCTEWLRKNYALKFLEMHYADIQPKIFAEQYIEDINTLYEYQFWCFDGDPKFVSVIKSPHKENLKKSYDMNWKELSFITSPPKNESKLYKPKNFTEMIDISKKLSKEFNFVRVDLYNCNNNILFSEMTFTPAAGYVKWEPEYYDDYFGDMLKI